MRAQKTTNVARWARHTIVLPRVAPARSQTSGPRRLVSARVATPEAPFEVGAARNLGQRLAPDYDSVSISTVHREAGPVSWTHRWWPVASLEMLDPKVPKHVDVLNLSLVVWTDSKGQWHCMEDKCPHRLAPMSEGRVEGDSLACSYHGWAFNAQGTCTRIPQLEHDPKAHQAACSSRRSCTKAYPTRAGPHGLLWVWPESGPEAEAAAASAPIANQLVPTATPWFQRDLFARFDSLCENLLDPSHVCFSHHGVMGNRNKPGNMWPTMTISPVEQSGFAANAKDYPTHEIRFTAPYTIRYNFGDKVMLQFMAVPTKPGWTRLFWSIPDMPKLLAAFPTGFEHWKLRNPLLDGDVYMLHAAERHMPLTGGVGIQTTSKLYYIPYVNDLAVMAMRRWSQDFGGDIPTLTASDQPLIPPLAPKTQVLDRWNQHTKDCPHCLKAIALLDRARLAVMALGLSAAAGAVAAVVSVVLLPHLAGPAAAQLLPAGTQLASSLVPWLVASAAVSAGAWKLCHIIGDWKQKFYYEEYVHALRD